VSWKERELIKYMLIDCYSLYTMTICWFVTSYNELVDPNSLAPAIGLSII
jgi:hypothetical protein